MGAGGRDGLGSGSDDTQGAVGGLVGLSRATENGGLEALAAPGAPLNGRNPEARPGRKSKPVENRGYTRVLHNTHVDLLSPSRVLECRESTTKVRRTRMGKARVAMP